MANPLILTDIENSMLQDQFRSIYEDDRVRSLEGPVILSILNKLEAFPTAVIFTEQENRRMQVQLESFVELLKPYPYPYSPLTFGQDTRQLSLIQSVLSKIEAAQ